MGSTNECKPRLANYKSYAKHFITSCSISKHFNTICKSHEDTSAFLSFQLIYCLENVDRLSIDEIDDLLLQNEKHWFSTLVTMHKGMNITHDWNLKKRTDVDDSL